MNKKYIFMLLILVVAVAAAVICLTQLELGLPGTGNSTKDYNEAATNHGLSGSYLSDNELLLAVSIDKQEGKTLVTYRIFALNQGVEAQDFLGLTAAEASGKDGIVPVGTASCEFIGDNLKNIRNFQVSHNM